MLTIYSHTYVRPELRLSRWLVFKQRKESRGIPRSLLNKLQVGAISPWRIKSRPSCFSHSFSLFRSVSPPFLLFSPSLPEAILPTDASWSLHPLTMHIYTIPGLVLSLSESHLSFFSLPSIPLLRQAARFTQPMQLNNTLAMYKVFQKFVPS